MSTKRLKEILTINDFHICDGEIAYVEWKEIKKVLGAKRWKNFNKFMIGQTCREGGAYSCDVEDFL
jgi:hypothetical protein